MDSVNFKHIPVLLNESINGLNIKSNGYYADGTAGGGNHSYEIGMRLADEGSLLCVDRDIEAIKACEQKLNSLSCSVAFLHSSFCNLPQYLEEKKIMLDGLLLDLGVSSYQLDTAERGFSYMADGVLDMRMNKDDAMTAKTLVNTYSEKALERVFFEYGEEKYSHAIASKIVYRRSLKPIETTLELVEIIKSAMPPKALREKQHPAKRVFQAIRIEVNGELTQLSELLNGIIPYIKSGGRICIITFHSLEDRVVKSAFARLEKPCTCPPDFPVCVCGKKPYGKAFKQIGVSDEELEANPRARSARLRIFEKY